MAGSGMEGGEIQVGVLVKEITQKLYGGTARGKTGIWHMGKGDAATLSPGHLSLPWEVRWEKALASASHMITKHTEFVGVFN